MRVLFLGIHLVGAPARARTWHILEDGTGDAVSVQAGIDLAAVGDTVLVGAGTFYENLEFRGRDIVLKSESGSSVDDAQR